MNEEVMRRRPVYRWRSFWLGMPGLVFLLWVWVDSFTHASVARSRMKLYGQGVYMESGALEMCVQRGMALFHWSRVVDASPDIVVNKRPLIMERRKGALPDWRTKEDGLYGFEAMVRPLEVSKGRVTLKTVLCWFPVWFVVAGYAVVWLGSLVMWRWWVRRRWQATQVVVEGRGDEREVPSDQ